MKKIIIIMGTRPEAIKLVPVIQEFRKYSKQFNILTLVTAQHRQMLDQVLDIFSVTPNYDLDLMRHDQGLSEIAARSIEGISKILDKEKPNAVIVQGDTITAFAGALAAFHQKIPVGHVEAGLRSFNNYHPFPEEINRKLISVLAEFNFAPTDISRENLENEGIPHNRIFVTGNTVVDALNFIQRKNKGISESILIDNEKKLILVTAHRRENFGKPLESICRAIKTIVKNNPDVQIVYPVHFNPNVKNTVHRILKDIPRIHLIDPIPYPEFINLMCHSYLILTDSGGLQEEGPSLRKPVLIMRDTTERPEGVTGGGNILVGTKENDIVHEVKNLLDNKNLYTEITTKPNPFGDGKASEKIVEIFKNASI